MNRYAFVLEYRDENTSSAEYMMQDALFDLIRKGENLSVRTVTEQAGLERSTFYAFYERVDDLIEQAENRIISETLAFDEEQDLSGYLDMFLSFFNENRKEIEALLYIRNRFSFIRKLRDSVKYYLASLLPEFSVDNEIRLDAAAGAIINPFLSYAEEERDVDLALVGKIVSDLLHLP